jgi:antitoxin component of MazEF toxin-antitoxin module
MTHLIHIGNSLGVRIPKAVIAQIGFREDTQLVFKITAEGLLICPTHNPREGWSESFKNSSKNNPLLTGEEIVNEFDKDEWEW